MDRATLEREHPEWEWTRSQENGETVFFGHMPDRRVRLEWRPDQTVPIGSSSVVWHVIESGAVTTYVEWAKRERGGSDV